MVKALEQSEQVRQRAIPISVAAYHELGRTGLISEKTELLQGVIVEKMPKSPPHTFIVSELYEQLREAASAGHVVFKEDPLTFIDSEPEPDAALVAGSRADFRDQHPTKAVLVIEVAVSTEATDRLKAEIYAEAGIPEYWLVLPEKKQIEVFSQPRGAVYSVVHTFGAGEQAASAVLAAFAVAVDSLFGK